MSPTMKGTGVLLVSYALAIGLWSPSAANADDGDIGDTLAELDPEDLEGFDLPDFSGDGAGNFWTLASSLNVRAEPTTDAEVVQVLTEPTSIDVSCQVQGETVSADGYTNDWWAYVPDLGGYLTNIYADTPDAVLPDVPTCDDGMSQLTPEDLDGNDDLGTTGGFTTWGSGVNVRSGPSTDTDVVNVLDGPTEVEVSCQMRGELVSADGYTNEWWAHVPDLGGYVSNIYVDIPEAVLPGVPDCMEAEQEVNPTPEPDNSTTKEPQCSTVKLSYDPRDDCGIAEWALFITPGGPGVLAHIKAINALGGTVTLGGSLAGSLGIATGSGGVGVYFGPDGTYGRFRSHSIGVTTPSGASISVGAEEAIFFGGPELLAGESYVIELSGNYGLAEAGAKVILPTDLESIRGLAASVGAGISTGRTPVSIDLKAAMEWTETYDPASVASLCDV